jgi:hypothetical protein
MALLVAGILATASAWRDRHPDTTSDFTLFYVSAQQSTPQMFAHPPGPPRGNMNPPLFHLCPPPPNGASPAGRSNALAF